MHVVEVPISLLVPNPWNPNQMTEEEFCGLCREVKRLGNVAKPIVVRRQGDRYEIVDGEHNYLAALEVGLTTVPVEIEELDDAHAKLETLKRNKHGSHDRVREGRLYRSMQQDTGFTGRRFAQFVDEPESTIRGRIRYAEAAELRAQVDPDHAASTIAALTEDQVDNYLKLPAIIRDRWLDAGMPKLPEIRYRGFGTVDLIAQLDGSPLAEFVSADLLKFKSSFTRVLTLLDIVTAAKEHHGVDLLPYAAVLAKWERDPQLIRLVRRVAKGSRRLVVGMDAWATIVEKAVAETRTANALVASIKAGIRREMRKQSIDYQTIYSQPELEILDWLESAPAFLRNAEFLSLHVCQVILQSDLGLPTEKAWLAKSLVVEELRRREFGTPADNGMRLREKKLPDMLSEAATLVSRLPEPSANATTQTAATVGQDPVLEQLMRCRSLALDESDRSRAAEQLRRDLLLIPPSLRVLLTAALAQVSDVEAVFGAWWDACKAGRAVRSARAKKPLTTEDDVDAATWDDDPAALELFNPVAGLDDPIEQFPL